MRALEIGVLNDFVSGVPHQLRVEGRVLVIVRIEDDVYVLDDRCSHEDFSLSEGEVDVDSLEIECARHGSMFRLKDGEPTSLPATRPVAHYDVRAVDGHLEVLVP
ncbi:MAG: Rieske 2Fe-2S domain-containing protein [Acidimicrobiales bacterium]